MCFYWYADVNRMGLLQTKFYDFSLENTFAYFRVRGANPLPPANQRPNTFCYGDQQNNYVLLAMIQLCRFCFRGCKDANILFSINVI